MRQFPQLDRDIGARLRNARIRRGLSQEKLAEALGITFQQVQKYEKGANRVACSTLLRACAALRVEPLDILGAVPESGVAPLPVITDPNALRAADLVARLPSAAQRSTVVRMLATFVPGELAEAAE